VNRSWVVVPCLLGLLAGCSDDGGTTPTSAPTSTVDLGQDEGDGTLRITTTFPSTPAGQAQEAAVGLAVDDVNAAGGVLGNDVELGGRVSDADVDVVIGVVPGNGDQLRSVTAAGRAWLAPAGQTVVDGRLAFRIGASDDLLDGATADLVVEDGARTATVGSPNPDRVDALAAALGDRGVTIEDGNVVSTDAVVLAESVELAETLEGIAATGYSLPDHGIYLLGGTEDTTIGEQLADRIGVLEGTNVLRPGAEVTGDLRDRLPDTGDLSGTAEAYDSVVIAALAAEAAQTDDPGHLGAEVIGVTRGGSTCTSFEECKLLVDHGDDVVLAGQGGTYALGPDGQSTEGVVAVLEYGSDNRIDPNRTEYRVATTS
jgi:branched-chain amino acid transport system substrate-binding protein